MKRLCTIALFFLMTTFSAAADDMAPALVKAQEDPRIAQQTQSLIDQLKTMLDKVKAASGGKFDPNAPIDLGELKKYGFNGPSPLEALQTALNLMQEFGLIDPSEKFVQPDLNPPGQPELPSRAAKDPNLSAEEYAAFRKLQQMIDLARNHLEKNYVVLKQTELKTRRLTELAGSAANISGIAGLYWAKIQGDPKDPMNIAKATFYAKYDSGQANGLKYLNDALKQMSEFERRNYGDPNWYVYYGLPYYNFMVARYTRPGAGAPP